VPGKREERWRADPAAFVREALINPETGQPFELYSAEERFLREAFTVDRDGKLPYAELIYGAPKKSGKTGFSAICVLYVVVVLGGPYAEGIVVANDFEQAQGRVFQAISRIIEASPKLRDSAKLTANRIEFLNSGATIIAIASEYAGAAGANPSIVAFDELWGVTSESGQRLFDECVPVPTRQVSVRLTTTYAGFEGESELLEGLYKRGLQGEEIAPALYRQPGLLMLWSHRPLAPWQTPEWIEQMRSQLRPNAFLRLIENRWVTSESTFVPVEWFDECIDADLHPELADPRLSVWAGVDASVKRDSTAIVCCAFDPALKKVRLVWHRIFQPTAADPLIFEETIETTLLELRRRFYVREVRFDPYQLVAVAQRLTAAGLPMVEFPQSVPNLTEASSNLYELLKGRNLAAYADDEIRLAVSRCVAIETSRGWRIAKEKVSHKIDVVVALAQAALGAVQQGQAVGEYIFYPIPKPGAAPYGRSELGKQQRLDAQDDARGKYSRERLRGRHGRWAGV
jgi:phage terminase large subunit-like protein